MDKIKILLLFLVISTVALSQKVKYLDSIFIKHTFNSKVVISEYLEPTVDLLDSNYLRIASDENMNLFISDSLTSMFIKPTHIKEKKLYYNLLENVDNLGMDSSSNVLFVRVYNDSCQTCINSIIDIILDYNDIQELITDKTNKTIYVNYYQVIGELKWEFITVTVRRRFGSSYSYTLYSEM